MACLLDLWVLDLLLSVGGPNSQTCLVRGSSAGSVVIIYHLHANYTMKTECRVCLGDLRESIRRLPGFLQICQCKLAPLIPIRRALLPLPNVLYGSTSYHHDQHAHTLRDRFTFNFISNCRVYQMIVQFAPLSSLVQPAFWHELTNLKIDVLRLSDEILPISASYGVGRSVKDRETGQEIVLGTNLTIGSDAFEKGAPQ